MKRSGGNHFHARLPDKVYPGTGAGTPLRKLPGAADTAGEITADDPTRDLGGIALPAAADQHQSPGRGCQRECEKFTPSASQPLHQADFKVSREGAKLAKASRRNQTASEGASSGSRCPTSGTDLSRASVPWRRARISRVTSSPVIA